MDQKNVKLRILWVIPNATMYLFFIGLSVFVLVHSDELQAANVMGAWLIMLALLLVVTLFGTFRILSWIKQGKM